MDGITATQEVRRLFPRTAVLVLTVFDPPAIMFDALGAGALGLGLLVQGRRPLGEGLGDRKDRNRWPR